MMNFLNTAANTEQDKMKGVFLSAKLPQLNHMNAERRCIAKRYLTVLHYLDLILTAVPDYAQPVWHILALCCSRRDELEKHLNSFCIMTNKHYLTPMDFQKCYWNHDYKQDDYPLAEEISQTELSMPMFYVMTKDEIQFVINSINDFRSK